MNLADAVNMANKYFESINKGKVSCALDTDTHWIFYGGDPNVVEFGGSGIKIEKETGIMEDFYLPDIENFRLLDQSHKLIIENDEQHEGDTC